MEEWIYQLAGGIALALELVAILMVAFGSIAALVAICRVMFAGGSNADKRQVWLHHAQWLVAALTFQLAADIVSTAVAPDWDQVGRLAAIAAIRTLLTFFLDRDIEGVRERDQARRAAALEKSV